MLRQSPFFEFLNAGGPDMHARLADGEEDVDYIDWNGYFMPSAYREAKAEYEAIRGACAACDISPMRKLRITGADSGALLDHLLTRRASTRTTNTAGYVIFCNEDGSLQDDAMLYKFADDDYLLLPSDLDHRDYFHGLAAVHALDDVRFEDVTHARAGLALQGPYAAGVLIAMGVNDAATMAPFEIRHQPLGEGRMAVARMGFTADLGYECWCDARRAPALAELVAQARDSLDLQIPGYGLDALQSCRLEGGFIVAGWDCSTEVYPRPGFERTPFELGLGWLVNLEDADFVGRRALAQHQRQGPSVVLRHFTTRATSPLPDGTPVLAAPSADAARIGQVTSSAWSWGLDARIGNASLSAAAADVANGWISLDGTRYKITLQTAPPRRFDRLRAQPAPILPARPN